MHTPAYLQHLGVCAVRALYEELSLEPKPGLVSLRDSGSHTDMDATTFLRSLFALRSYFPQIARAGVEGQPFVHLQTLGIAAEARMLRATAGVNTHRGAVFGLGLLCAGAGALHGAQRSLSALSLRHEIAKRWGAALQERVIGARAAPARSNGQRAAREYGLRSAAEEAALVFPTLFEATLPALQNALAAGVPARAAKVQALFATMAVLDDTNLAHRGGLQGLRSVQARAAAFLDAGGVLQQDWMLRARALHASLVQERLSPGGAADVLAGACFVHQLLSSNAGTGNLRYTSDASVPA